MKKKTLIFFILMISVFFNVLFIQTGNSKQKPPSNFKKDPPLYMPDEILVIYKPNVSEGQIKSFHFSKGIQEAGEFFLTGKKDKKVHKVRIKQNKNIDEEIEELRKNSNVEHAQKNYIRYFNAVPNDSSFGQLWGLHNTGQTVNGAAGTLDADIDAPEAWDITTGTNSVVVAVIDTGVSTDNPGLSANIWLNSGDSVDGSDNDGNGYIDDINGWDFYDNDNDPTGFHAHGTHVAGTIGAVGNNSTGITGVCWNIRIMALKIGGVEAFTTDDISIQAINYAAANNARVINASWGGPGGYDDDLLCQSIQSAGNAGVLFVAAAGNDNADNDDAPSYPASYSLDCIISVAATDQNDNLANFSNYGAESVDVAAPGVNIYSTIPIYSYGAPVTLYSKDFDSDTAGQVPSGWSRGGTNSSWAANDSLSESAPNSLEDSPGGNYSDNTNSWVVYNSIIDYTKDNRYMVNCKVKYDLETNYDYLGFIYTPDKANWHSIDYRTGSSGGSFVSIQSTATYLVEKGYYFGFGLYSDTAVTENGVFIDDFSITSEPMSIASHSHAYYQGTSMAAPHVVGIAGLLLSQNPGLTVSQLKSLILDGVDEKSSLSGKMVTGGRVNACNSLKSGGTFVDFQSGGTVFLSDNTSVTVPAGAFSEDVNIFIKKCNDSYSYIAEANSDIGGNDLIKCANGLNLARGFTVISNESGKEIKAFNKPVTIAMVYPDVNQDGLVDDTNLNEENLEIFLLDGDSEKWSETENFTIDKQANNISMEVMHFSTYTIMGVIAPTAMSDVKGYPNPCYLKQDEYIRIGGIPSDYNNVKIYIYDISGKLIRTLEEGDEIETRGHSKLGKWDGRNENNEKAASGVYIYLMKSDKGKKTEKIAIFW